MKKRTKAEALRYRRWAAENYPCRGCGIEDETRVLHHFTFLDAGMGQKEDDSKGAVLCYTCHTERLHRHGEKSFWAALGVDLDELVFESGEMFNSYKE